MKCFDRTHTRECLGHNRNRVNDRIFPPNTFRIINKRPRVKLFWRDCSSKRITYNCSRLDNPVKVLPSINLNRLLNKYLYSKIRWFHMTHRRGNPFYLRMIKAEQCGFKQNLFVRSSCVLGWATGRVRHWTVNVTHIKTKSAM